MSAQSDRNLLIGIIALQMDFITRDQMIAGMQSWVLDKSRSLGALLVEQGALAKNRSDLLHALVDEHLKQHGNDVEKSLAAVSSLKSVREDLQSLDDSDVEASLVHVSNNADHEPFTTITIGTSTSEGGRFRILRPHARGGLGEVSVAFDEELRREVALKEVLAKYSDNPDSQSRFLAEAEITGGLEHPGIVPVYGLGTFDDGRPYYAMRFIRGDSLKTALAEYHQTDWTTRRSGERSIQLRKLLSRFVDVCNAISYAHSRGVLHRDLKPGNIMLGKYGETLVVDWGLAKAAGVSPTESVALEPPVKLSSGGSSETLPGSAIGTPAYMSPEQAAGQLDDLGPATDVYSLGATLYHLLTGRIAFDESEAGIGDLLQRIQKGTFPRPRQIDDTIPKPLEAICLKAMSVHREDRYEKAQELADDVERWLADESVNAWQEPVLVRTGRWVRQHQTLAATAAAVMLVSLCALGIVSTIVSGKNEELADTNTTLDERNQKLDEANVDLGQANSELKQTNLALDEVNSELDDRNTELNETIAALQVAEKKSQEEAAIATAVNDFLEDDLLGNASPDAEPDRDIKLRTILDRAAASIGDRFEDQPLVEASIQLTIGTTFLALGDYAQAERHLERSRTLRHEHLGDEHRLTLTSQSGLALLYCAQGRYKEAEPLYLQTLETGRRVLGEEHRLTLSSQNNLAALYKRQGRYKEAEPLYLQTLETSRRVLGDEHPGTLTSQNNLAVLHCGQGRYKEAEPLYLQTLETRRRVLGEEHPDTLTSQSNLALLYLSQNRYEEAEPLLLQTLETKRRVQGVEHPGTLTSQNNLAGLYEAHGRYEEAVPLLLQTLEARRRVLGDEHPDTLSSQSNLAALYKRQGRYKEAEPLYLQTLETSRRVLGEDHHSTLTIQNDLVLLYKKRGRYKEAEPLYLQTLETRRRVLGEEHPDTLTSQNNIATLYYAQGRFKEAEPLYLQTLETGRRVLGEEHRLTLSSQNNLAALYKRQGRYKEAEPLYLQTLETSRRVLGDEHPGTLTSQNNLAVLHCAQGRYKEAEPLYLQTLETRRRVLGEEHPDTLTSQNNLALLYKEQGRYKEAETLYLRTLEARRRVLGKEHPSTLSSQHNLAALYYAQGRYGDAESLYLELLNARRRRLGDLHPLTLKSEYLLSRCLFHLEKDDAAEELLLLTIENHRRVFNDSHSNVLNSLNRLALLYERSANYEKALPIRLQRVADEREKRPGSTQLATALLYLGKIQLTLKKNADAETNIRESLEIRRQKLPDSWLTFNAMSELSESLAGQEKFEEAESLARDGFEGLLERSDSIPESVREERLMEAAERVVKLYTAWGKPDEAAKWQARRDKLKSQFQTPLKTEKPTSNR